MLKGKNLTTVTFRQLFKNSIKHWRLTEMVYSKTKQVLSKLAFLPFLIINIPALETNLRQCFHSKTG